MMRSSKPARHYIHRLFHQSWPATGVVGSRSYCHSIARLLPSRLSMSNSTCLIHANNTQLQQQRNFFWFFDSRNPVLELAKISQTHVIDFSRVTPRHVLDASKQVRFEYKDLLSTSKYQNSSKLLDQFKTVAALTSYLKSQVETMETTSQSIDSIATLMYQVNIFEPAWYKACITVHREQHSLFKRKDKAILKFVMQQINNRNQLLSNGDGKASLSDLEELNQLLQGSELGSHLPDASADNRQNQQSALNSDAMDELNDAEQELLEEIMAFDGDDNSSMSTKERLLKYYGYLAIKQDQAELLGYDSHVDRAMDRRNLCREEIEALLVEVADRAQKARDALEVPLATRSVSTRKQDNAASVSEYITLDGTLQGLFALCKSLFGIVVSEDNNPKGWHMDVRLFHVANENDERLGSFYLDPYERPNKKVGTFIGLLTPDIVFISTDIKPPLWDHLPNKVEVKSVMSIFHEFGHVLRYLLADADKRRGMGTDLTTEIIEIVPQFMSQWVINESVLQTLAHLSSETQIPQEIIAKVQEKHRLLWIERCLLHAFEGHLEFEMFSNRKKDDAASKDSLVAMHRRLLERFLPHDTRPKSDLQCLERLLKENATGTSISAYRHLLNEVISAEIFQVFDGADLSDENEMKKLGRKLRQVVLEPGVHVDLKQVLREFFGRESLSSAGFFKMYKL